MKPQTTGVSEIAAASCRASARIAHDLAAAIERQDLPAAALLAADLGAFAVTVQTLVSAAARRAAPACDHPADQQRISRAEVGDGLVAFCRACRTERPWDVAEGETADTTTTTEGAE